MSQKKDNSLFFNESCFLVAEKIFSFPNKTFYIRMLERELKLSTTAIIDAITKLSKNKIVKIEKTRLTTNIKADLESENYPDYKKIFNIYHLKKYEVIGTLIKMYQNPGAIVLFGSFAKGEDIEESDIDILVITHTKKDISTYISKLESKLNRKVNILTLPTLENSSDEFKNAVANGIVMHGYLKVL